jgi:hypothetical protein
MFLNFGLVHHAVPHRHVDARAVTYDNAAISVHYSFNVLLVFGSVTAVGCTH